MRHFSTFGLTIAANGDIPQLPHAHGDGACDFSVWLGERPSVAETCEVFPPLSNPSARVDHPCRSTWYPATGMVHLAYRDGCEFHISADGRQVWANWPPTMTVEDMVTYLLGPVMGFLLRLHGLFPLHASAVAIDDFAICLMGPAGAGKSTTAAAFALAGYPVLADDVSALEPISGGYLVRPAYPHLRLWPESADILFGDRRALAPITPNWDKLDLPLAEENRFHTGALRLAALYLLDSRSEEATCPAIASVSGADQLVALVANTYRNDLLDAAAQAKTFETLAHLTQCVAMRRVTPHTDPARLPTMCERIAADARRVRARESERG